LDCRLEPFEIRVFELRTLTTSVMYVTDLCQLVEALTSCDSLTGASSKTSRSPITPSSGHHTSLSGT